MMDTFFALAESLADAVRPIVMKHFRAGVDVDSKDDASPVTVADREAETAMRALIERNFPDHGIIGEEHGEKMPDAEYVWVLDPVDGTRSFVTGNPLFGTLIGLARRGRPILGVMDAPALGERWVGGEGRATTMNAKPVRARACAGIGEAWLYAGAPQDYPASDLAAFERLRRQCRGAAYCADWYAYGLLASGLADLVVEADLQPYDFAALVAVVRGGGGYFTDWQGGEITLASRGGMVAAGDRRTHLAACRVLGAG